ncbi:hypothetical protein [Peribacillus asahii]|nr:hypothetical protein [Peribacillus asahii]
MLKSKVFIITALIFSLLSIFIIKKREVIFQEGNPIPLVVAISKMIFQDKEMVEVWRDEEYLVKQGEFAPFIEMMDKDGWNSVKIIENANHLVFEKDNMTKSISYKDYTRYYTIIYSY